MSNYNPGQPPGPPGAPPGGGYGAPPPGGGGYGGPPPGGYGAPPPGGYGAPPPGGYGAPAPYGQPQTFGMQPNYVAPVEGSIGLGFCAGFFGGCIGLILVYAIAKGPATKKGAGIGFAAQLLVGGVMRVLANA